MNPFRAVPSALFVIVARSRVYAVGDIDRSGTERLTLTRRPIKVVAVQPGISPLAREILFAGQVDCGRGGTLTTHVVITGASSGLGAALARHLSPMGYALSLFGRDVTRLAAIADACRTTGGAVEIFSHDVTDAAAMAAALRTLDSRVPVDIVIANAGLGGSQVLAPRAGEPLDLARGIADVNLLGVINTVAPLTGSLTARGNGHIVIISSMAGLHGLAESPVYSASKAAARVYGEGLRRLLAPVGVRVTVVLPGFITTPMSQSLPFRRPFDGPRTGRRHEL